MIPGENRLLRQIVCHLILGAGVIFLVTPLLTILMASTMSSADIREGGIHYLPGDDALQNFARIFSLRAGFTEQITTARMLWNSVVVATGVATFTTVFSLLAAYALVYFRQPFAGALFALIFVTLLFPIEARFVTTFQVTSALGLIDTRIGMVLPAIAAALGTLFFRQLFRSFPEEYLEAAKLDAAGPWRFLIDIIVPLSRRRGMALFLVSFMIGWNQYLWPLMVSTTEQNYTLVRGVQLIGQLSGPGMALATLTILPPLLLLLMFGRWLMRDLTATGDQLQ